MIKIEDLDKFEGLTADMVRAWLRANGWTVKRADRFREWWEKGAEGAEDGFWLPTEFGVEWFWIHALAAVHGLTVQSLLREINPRMRAGWPTDEERAKHRYWIAQEDVGSSDSLHIGCFDEDDEDGTPVFVAGYDLWTEEDVRRLDMKFWPCDQHGNKTRRGA